MSGCTCHSAPQSVTLTTMSQYRRYDPTRTITLRKRFEQDAAGRLRRLKAEIRRMVVERNAFGLTVQRDFAFERSSQKIDAFMAWLVQQSASGLLEVTRGPVSDTTAEKAWAATYVRTAYRRGMEQAAANLAASGATVGANWAATAFTRPFHVDRVGIISTRLFEQLKGIDSAMSQGMSRVLADGLSQGKGMQSIAKDLTEQVDKIGIRRARVLARTEVINAHAEAALNSYEEAGLLEVTAEVEFLTAQDSRVCEKCAALSGKRLTLREARGKVPVHPNCRCAWAPIIADPRDVNLQ